MPVLTDSQLELRDTVRSFADQMIAPITARMERAGEHPADLVESYREMGWLELTRPEEYGGAGGGTTEWCVVEEQVSRVSLAAAHLLGHNAANTVLSLLGTHEQKAKFFPILADRYASFMSSEAQAGSDVGAISTTAVEHDGHFVINGFKQWASNAAFADFHCVIATVEPGSGPAGLRMFFIDARESAGIKIERTEELMGLRGATVSAVALENVEVPVENCLSMHGGTKDFVELMSRTRSVPAAQAVGVAQGAFEYALSYTLEREQFGRPVFEFQAVSHMIADMAIQIEAARELTYWAAGEADRGGARRGQVASMAKTFASDVAMKVTTDAVQCLGGAGYTKDHPVERMMRDAKILQIYEGTNQVQRNGIAGTLARGLGSGRR